MRNTLHHNIDSRSHSIQSITKYGLSGVIIISFLIVLCVFWLHPINHFTHNNSVSVSKKALSIWVIYALKEHITVPIGTPIINDTDTIGHLTKLNFDSESRTYYYRFELSKSFCLDSSLSILFITDIFGNVEYVQLPTIPIVKSNNSCIQNGDTLTNGYYSKYKN
jgi:hypothetical protein